MNFLQFVIPGSTRNAVFFWIPAFAGMTFSIVIDVIVYRLRDYQTKGLQDTNAHLR